MDSLCRKCGGDREHLILFAESRPWSDDEYSINGNDSWYVLECRGCHTITFLHRHWFSEESDEHGLPPDHKDLYPPSPTRRKPEWGIDLFLCLKQQDLWIAKLHEDIYAAIGFKALSLATMGIRAIIDFVVTSKACDKGTFADKLGRMFDDGLITDIQLKVVEAAFDAGSAAAHRGYRPTRDDVYLLLDIAEVLLERFYISPVRDRRRAKAVEELRLRTPRRTRSVTE